MSERNELPYRALILDFDRTLLHTDKRISANSVRVLRDWQQAGACLFAATARPERAITAYCGMIAFDAVTTLNGARTITREAVFENPLPPDSAASVLAQLYRIPGTVISAETADGFFASAEIPAWQPEVLPDLRVLPGRARIYKLLASHPGMPVEQLAVDLPADLYCTVAEGSLIQVMSRAATKWNGVQRMLETFRIPAEQAIYFGDDNDDIEPIRRCGLGVAVSNALEAVRLAADCITASNDEDGVAAFLTRLRQ